MALESGTYISDLNPSNPVGATDKVSTLDDHVRLIKSTLQNTFPNIDGAVTATEDELNHLDGVTGTTGTGKLVLDDAPTIADLTVTDSITLPAASIADAALSDNVPLKDAPNVFTQNGAVTPAIKLEAAAPALAISTTTGGTDEGTWVWRANGDQLQLRTSTDSGSLVDIPFRVFRSGTSASEVRLEANSITLNGNVVVGGAATFSNNVTVGGTISGNGSGLTNLNASNLSSGTVPSARLPATIGGNKTFSDNVTVGGTITGNGSGLTNLNASNLSSGTVPGARLGGNQTMAGNKTFSNNVTVGGTLEVGGAVRAGTAATSTSATLVAGQIHHRSSNTTVPSMNAGQWVAVQNTSTSSITLSQGSGVTLELGGTTTTGNRTLLPKGFAFIYFRANGVGVVHGSGVT